MNWWVPREGAPTLDAEGGREVWAWVPGAYGRYAVSNLGRVQSWTRKKPGERWEWGDLLEPTVSASGYLSVGIYYRRGESAKTRLVHQLVLEAFCVEPRQAQQTDVRHLNGQKDDNRLCNLAWGTRSENMLDVIVHRRSERAPTPAEREGASWYQGYTHDDYLVRVGLEFHAEGRLTIEALTRMWRCSRDVAQNIVRGETRVHVPRPATVERQPRRNKARKEAIMALVREGKNAAQINEALGETLTPQAVHYYRNKVRLAGGG